MTRSLDEHINWDVVDEIGILTINNPHHNYLLKPEFVSLKNLKEAIGSSEIKGLIIRGEGRHFSAGANIASLRKLSKDAELLEKEMVNGKQLLDYIGNLSIPVIAAVQGVCFGGGLEIALASHIIICGENSLFAFPEVNNSLMPGLGGTVRLSRRIGFPESTAILLSGDVLHATTAKNLNLVDKVLPAKEVFDYAFNLMRKMVSGRTLKVINYIVRALNNSQEMSFQNAMQEETKMFIDLAMDEIKHDKDLKSE